MRRIVIELDRDLPLRPRALAADALSKVFGGCVNYGQCVPDATGHGNCCTLFCVLYKPYPNWPGAWYCDVQGGGGE
jgi:hypothetical protein